MAEKKTVALDVGMLLLDPGSDSRGPTVYTATSKSTIVAHHGSFSEKATLRKPGFVPSGWKIINNKALAAELMEKLSQETPDAG